ncbi:DUF1840 domain-containing protein [Rhodopseudomonas palustris]|uniref:DUF1840 domain-containing protein n=1 Tax=Thiospirillum jenense TaxID=1653858 RepID=A0A839HDW2_9GAMM|nr:DUF1840 domain-containing protein [Thiospirillum jenense]MBB1091972.1 DUF1840 domain-containing protein [Rhodopseudomonas palustris]MBB1126310.1 DUF1840 domain-containing protein [Thiospirillum jenense]
MLVTFKTDAHADIIMFGDVAIALLNMMGHSGHISGALLAEDIPAALTQLRAAVAANPERPLNPPHPAHHHSPRELADAQLNSVSLAHRALPLIQLLEAAQARNKNVLWDY